MQKAEVGPAKIERGRPEPGSIEAELRVPQHLADFQRCDEPTEASASHRDAGVVTFSLQHHRQRHQSLVEWQRKRKERQCLSALPAR